MLVIAEKTEIRLLNELKRIAEKPQGWRALFIKFSSFPQLSKDTIRETIEFLSDGLLDDSSKVYLFSDGDVIVVYQGLSLSLIEKLSQKLENSFSLPANKFSNVFDLEKNLIIPVNICKKKIEFKELEEKAKKQSEIEKVEIAKDKSSGFHIDAELLKNLKERREKNEKTKILLIEDDAFSRRMVKNILSKESDVIEAENGSEALIKYVQHAPHIVFLDINLPDANGMELLERLIEIDDGAFVIMLSGNSVRENIIGSIQKGAKGFVTKPFPKEKLFHYLNAYNNL
jgi:two-component system chemotaxis response regulator CheY